jgi:NlpC/P60 family
MSHRAPADVRRLLWRKTSFWCCTMLVFIATWTIVFPRAAHAQCTRHPGDFLVGEDDERYYCESPASATDIGETLRDIETYLKNPPSPELLGARWRFRKSAIDTAGCVARNHAAYGWGAKYSVLEQCSNGKPIDCSGLAGYAYRLSACFVRGFYSAKDDTLGRLEDTAEGQAKFFKANGAWMDINAVPSPGDAIFFCCTYTPKPPAPPRDITHVAIYLGKRADGTMLVIQAVNSGVKIEALSRDFAGKIRGYGNAGELYEKLSAGR